MNCRIVCIALILLICGGLEAAGLNKIKDIIIYQDKMYYSCFPSIVQSANGELICAFRRAPDRRELWSGGLSHTDANSYLVLVRSKDGGQSWTKDPELIFAHPLGGSQDPCMVLLKDGTIICTSYGWAMLPKEGEDNLAKTLRHSPFNFLGGYVLRSKDGAKTWEGPFVPIPVPGDTSKDALGNPTPAFNRGAMYEGKDGKLYWAVASRNVDTHKRTSVHLMTSTDKAETWTYACPIAIDDKVTFNETSLIQTKKGDWVAFMRTDAFEGKLAYARSTDGGKSFEPWQDGGFFGHPFHAIHLKDGRVLLVYGYRQQPFGIRVKILNAECTDIATAQEYVLREDGGNTDIGYPWAVQLSDGRILVSYYYNINDGTRHIAASLLELR